MDFMKFKEFKIEGSLFTSSDSRCDYETEFQEFPPQFLRFCLLQFEPCNFASNFVRFMVAEFVERSNMENYRNK